MIKIALSIQQPWAWLIAHRHKDVENRTWATRRRGRILIHAGRKFDREAYDWVCATRPEIVMPPSIALERGGIIGEVEITGCVEESASPWFFGPFGFTLANARPLRFRPLAGRLGFFAVEPPIHTPAEAP